MKLYFVSISSGAQDWFNCAVLADSAQEAIARTRHAYGMPKAEIVAKEIRNATNPISIGMSYAPLAAESD